MEVNCIELFAKFDLTDLQLQTSVEQCVDDFYSLLSIPQGLCRNQATRHKRFIWLVGYAAAAPAYILLSRNNNNSESNSLQIDRNNVLSDIFTLRMFDSPIKMRMRHIDKSHPSFDAINQKVGNYLANLKSMNETLAKIFTQAYKGYADRTLLKLFPNQWEAYLTESMLFEDCQGGLQGKNITSFSIELTYKVPNTDPASSIVELKAFNMWNSTDRGPCWIRYSGPQYFLYNSSNNCFTFLENPQLTSSMNCTTQDKQLTHENNLFHRDICHSSVQADTYTT